MFTFFFQLLRECRVGALMREFVLDHCDSGSILRLTWGLSLSLSIYHRLKQSALQLIFLHFPN